MTEIKIRQTKDKSPESIPRGIKTKENNEKVRIAGAVLRLEVVPRRTNYYRSNDYKLAVWLPNGAFFEVDDLGTYSGPSFNELMVALIEAATGAKPKSGNETKTISVSGIPVKVLESEAAKTETIKTPIDPLTEKIVLPKLTETTETTANGGVADEEPVNRGHVKGCTCYWCSDKRKKRRNSITTMDKNESAMEEMRQRFGIARSPDDWTGID